MSISSWLNCDGFAIATPSMTTATEGSLLRACEMPRTVTNDVPWFCVCTRVMFGVRSMKSCGRSIPAASISAAVNTFTATGTSSDASSRLRAVTMTSSRLVVAAGVCAGRSGADAQSAARHASMTKRLLMFICGSPNHANSLRTMRAPSTMARNFASATSRGRYFMPQSGATTMFFAST